MIKSKELLVSKTELLFDAGVTENKLDYLRKIAKEQNIAVEIITCLDELDLRDFTISSKSNNITKILTRKIEVVQGTYHRTEKTTNIIDNYSETGSSYIPDSPIFIAIITDASKAVLGNEVFIKDRKKKIVLYYSQEESAASILYF